MARMTPDMHNGKRILRPVVQGEDGFPKLASSSVFHPPTIGVRYPHIPLGKLVDDEAAAIVGMKAMMGSELRDRLQQFALHVIENQGRLPVNG